MIFDKTQGRQIERHYLVRKLGHCWSQVESLLHSFVITVFQNMLTTSWDHLKALYEEDPNSALNKINFHIIFTNPLKRQSVPLVK